MLCDVRQRRTLRLPFTSINSRCRRDLQGKGVLAFVKQNSLIKVYILIKQQKRFFARLKMAFHPNGTHPTVNTATKPKVSPKGQHFGGNLAAAYTNKLISKCSIFPERSGGKDPPKTWCF